MLGAPPDEVSEWDAASVGSLAFALINGVMPQWMLDPGTTPNAAELAKAVAALGSA